MRLYFKKIVIIKYNMSCAIIQVSKICLGVYVFIYCFTFHTKNVGLCICSKTGGK